MEIVLATVQILTFKPCFAQFHVVVFCILRFVEQTEWFCADKRGKFNWDFLNHKDALLQDINMSNTLINHRGLSNFGNGLQLGDTFFVFAA